VTDPTTAAEDALNRMTDGFIGVDDNWAVTYVNDRAIELLGSDESPEVGDDFWEAFPGIYDSEFGRAYREAAETQEPASVEAFYGRLDGWFRATAYPAEDGISIYFRDVTDEKDLDRRLRRENELRERVFETTPTGVAVLDGDGTFLRANDRTRELLGFDEAALGTVNYADLDWSRADDTEDGLPVENVFEVGRSGIESEYVLTMSDGTRRYLAVSAAPLDATADHPGTGENDDEGDPDDTHEEVVVVIDDHTEQRLLERRLRDEQSSLRRLYEVAGDSELSFEEKLREILAVGRDRLGVELGFLTDIHGDTQHITEAVGSHQLIRSGESCPLSQAYCKRTIDEDGLLAVYDAIQAGWEDTEAYEVFELGCYIGGKVIVNGDLYGTLCFADHDPRGESFSESETTFVELLTQWVSYELERHESREQIERQNERLDGFASVVSHDLRNPLNVADARVELARDSGDIAHLDDAADALDRIDEIIDDMLSLARHGEDVVDTDPISLADVAGRAWEGIDRTEGATLSLAADLPTVRGDESRVVRLFEKLFGNAVDHAGDTVHVTVGSHDDGFYVADDGPGIPEEERGKVFERGFSTEQSGTGFGLGVVAEIAEAHEWGVKVRESSDGGARFEFGAQTFAVFEE
jgi:PAS domain S-box-containing protein